LRNYFDRKDVVTIEKAQKRIYKTHKENIILINFKGSQKKSLFECQICGHKWCAVSHSVWRGNGCPACYEKRRGDMFKHSIDYVKNFIESKNCKLFSKEYKNTKTPLKVGFECGHVGNISFESFRRGSRCSICGFERFKTSRKYSQKRINKIMKDNNLIFIGFPDRYINRKSCIKYSCCLGHINCVAFRDFLKTKKCYICSRMDFIKRVSGVNGSNWQGGLTEIKIYLLKRIIKWRLSSIKHSSGKCIISKEKYDVIHHLHSFNLILRESLDELNLELQETIGDYKKKDLKLLVKKVIEIHNRYPLGACLTRDWHMRFHNIYGYGNTSPEMWYEFLDKIESGEIKK